MSVKSKNQVKFKDVLRMVHPVPKDARQGEVFSKIMNDTLEVPYTWETELSANGQRTGSERKTPAVLWTELVQSGIEGWVEVPNIS